MDKLKKKVKSKTVISFFVILTLASWSLQAQDTDGPSAPPNSDDNEGPAVPPPAAPINNWIPYAIAGASVLSGYYLLKNKNS